MVHSAGQADKPILSFFLSILVDKTCSMYIEKVEGKSSKLRIEKMVLLQTKLPGASKKQVPFEKPLFPEY